LEAIRKQQSVRSAVIVTSDKCYDNREWEWAYRENEPLGGHDPYSSSKGCVEILTASYRASYFSSDDSPRIATARAGNVIGGGDWSDDRLVPDLVKAYMANEVMEIRRPLAIRPWQHVLEPLSGYICLAEKLYQSESKTYAEAWNFGPEEAGAKSVEWIVNNFSEQWDNKLEWIVNSVDDLHEATYLKLDSSKARTYLDWRPIWNIQQALKHTVDWYRGSLESEDASEACVQQILKYQEDKLILK